jgi:hypothetical protein
VRDYATGQVLGVLFRNSLIFASIMKGNFSRD